MAALLHIMFADEIKEATGFKNLSSDAFGSFTTLMGLVFSILLGQTYQYYFDRQGTIQDSAFREICALSRLLELVRLLDPPVDVRRSALNILKNYSKDLLNNGKGRRAADSGHAGSATREPVRRQRKRGGRPPRRAQAHRLRTGTERECRRHQPQHQPRRGGAEALQAAHTAVRDIDDARGARLKH